MGKTVYRLLVALVFMLLLLAGCSTDTPELETQASVPQIRVSPNTSGEPYTSLAGSTVSGQAYFYVPDHKYRGRDLQRVGWLLNGRGIDTDDTAPYSFRHDDALVDTTGWADGQYTITARYFYSGRPMQVARATFTVSNTSAQPEPEPEPAPTPEPEPEPEPSDPRGELIFYEGFDGSSLNRAVWDSCYPWGNEGGYSGFHGDGNCYNKSTGETQLYQPDNPTVSNGTLKLTARPERVCKNGKCFNYTSGMVASHPNFGGGFTTQYGYIEARMKLPLTKGMWPAFWTLPYPVEWPPEIDIMEAINGDSVHRMNYHYDGGKVGKNYYGADLSQWHTYAVDWRPGKIVWYFDGKEVFRTEGSHVTDKPQYLLLNLAVDGWADTPDSSTQFPAVMEIDYVRVYK